MEKLAHQHLVELSGNTAIGVGTALGLDNASGNMALDIRKYVEIINMNLISGNI